jgi:hypothetical protein
MISEQTGPGRKRSSLLAALERFRQLSVPSQFNSLLIFLYVCENEGLSVTELAYVADLLVPRVALLAKTLAGGMASEPIPSQAVLFELKSSPSDRRLRYIFLSDNGRRLRDEFEGLIGDARPILAPDIRLVASRE